MRKIMPVLIALIVLLMLPSCAVNQIRECKALCQTQQVAQFKTEELTCECRTAAPREPANNNGGLR